MGCDWCLTSAKGQNQSLETIKTEAKKYAVENKITVAIYKEANEYFYINAATAHERGIPVLQYISFNN